MTVAAAPTKLERFLRQHRISPAQLARLTGYAQPHLADIRFARVKPWRRTKLSIAIACGVLALKEVHVTEVFD